MVVAQFMELLRAGLWGKEADTTLFDTHHADWTAIYRLAQQQTVTGIVFDGMQSLPSALHPNRPLLMQWATQVARIEEANEHLNRVAGEIFALYKGVGLTPVLLKGQGIATCYHNPVRRQCGDIDVFTGKQGVNVADEALLQAGGVMIDTTSFKHSQAEYQDAIIENHYIAGDFNSPSANRKFQQLADHHLCTQTSSVRLNGAAVAVPGATFNAIFIFTHAFNHFLQGGIGLRHVCDWASTIAVHRNEIDAKAVRDFLRSVNLERASQAFAYVAVQHVGLERSALPFELSEKAAVWGEELLKEILHTGNFGRYNPTATQRPEGYWAGKWHTFTRTVGRCGKLRTLAPSEAFWIPLSMIKRITIVQFKRLQSCLNFS